MSRLSWRWWSRNKNKSLDDAGLSCERFEGGDRRHLLQALSAMVGGGAEHWATIASLIETCKLNDVDPMAYLTDVLTRIVQGHPNSDINQLWPWFYRKPDLKAVA
jgi:hypothetical protein